MRIPILPLLLTTLCLPAALAAQSRLARWALTLHLSRESFGGASSDTTSVPGTRVQVYPSSRLSTEIGVGRRFGAWDLWLGAGYAGGDLRARTDLLLLDDRTTAVRRYRGSVLIGRDLARLGGASLRLVGGPVLDHWSTTGLGDHTTIGARGGAVLRVPLGGLEFENRVLFGIGQSPFDRSMLPAEAVVESLRTWSIGAGLRLGL